MLRFLSTIFTILLFTYSHAQEVDKVYSDYASTYKHLISQNKFKEAQLVAIETIKFLNEKSPTDPRIAVGYKGIGFTFNQLQQYDSAIYYYQISLNTFLKHFGKENYNSATTRSLIGEAYYNQNKLVEAKKECLNANSIFHNLHIKKDQFVIDNYYLLYKIFRKLHEPTIAYQFILNSIRIAREEFNDSYEALPLFYKEFGVWHLESNNFEDAEEYFNTSNKYATKLNDNNIIIADYYYLGELYRKTGNFNASKNNLLLGINKNQNTTLPSEVKKINQMNLFSSLGILYSNQNNIDSALYYFDSIAKMAKQYSSSNEFPYIKEFYFEYGKVLSNKSENWAKAKDSFKHSILLLENNSTIVYELKANNHIELSNIYKKEGKVDSSLYHSETAKNILNVPDINDYHQFVNQIKVSDSLYINKNYKAAINTKLNIIKAEPKIFYKNDSRVADLYFKTGEAYAKLNNYKKAIENIWKAYHIYETTPVNRNAECTKAISKILNYYFASENYKEYHKTKELLKSFEYYE